MKFWIWIANLPSRFFKSLEQKGKYTTFVGLCMVIGASVKPLIEHNKGIVFEENYMWQVMYFIFGGIFLIILPSRISIKSGKGLEIIIED